MKNNFSVIYFNDAATNFFGNSSNEPQHFFSKEIWNQLYVFLNNLEVEKQKMQSNLHITYQDDQYSIDITFVSLKT